MIERRSIVPPPYIRLDWLRAAPQRSILDSAGTSLIAFDPQTHCGGVYAMEARAWTLIGPVNFQRFVSWLAGIGLKIDESHDLQLWLDQVSDIGEISGTRQ